MVGWPPIRSFRKNIASSSSKPAPESQQVVTKEVEKPESSRKGLFVKINMDGVPIGRKIDLKAYNSYEKLSCAVDELFRGLLAGYSHLSISLIQRSCIKCIHIANEPRNFNRDGLLQIYLLIPSYLQLYTCFIFAWWAYLLYKEKSVSLLLLFH